MIPRYIDEWPLDKQAKRTIKKELQKWVDKFTDDADGHTGQPRNIDFKNNDDLFFFTRCADINGDENLSNTEKDIRTRRRKRLIMMQLFLRELISGKTIKWRGSCNQCGNKNRYLFGIGLAGFVNFCPDCSSIHIHTDLNRLGDMVKELPDELRGHKIIK